MAWDEVGRWPEPPPGVCQARVGGEMGVHSSQRGSTRQEQAQARVASGGSNPGLGPQGRQAPGVGGDGETGRAGTSLPRCRLPGSGERVGACGRGGGRVQEGAGGAVCQHCQGQVRSSSCGEGGGQHAGRKLGSVFRGQALEAPGGSWLLAPARPGITFVLGGVEPDSPQDLSLSSPAPSLCPQMGTQPV